MLMTSEAAASKWCPLSPRPAFGGEHVHCLGDGCAAWRWKHAPGVVYPTPDGRNTSTPHGAGYCGLAGAPT